MIGIGFPIYGLREPKILKEFVKVLPVGHNKKVFIFNTAADFVSMNDEASGYLIRKLNRKGYNVFYDRTICMGCNFLIKYDNALVKQFYVSAKKKVEILCEEVLNGTYRIKKIGFLFRVLIGGLHWLEDNCGARMFGKSLKVSQQCSGCGECIRNCPSKNIRIKNGKIRFGFKCFLCMRCIYACPNNAIVSRGYNFVILKDGYRIKEIIQNRDIKDVFITENTKGSLKHFQRYFDDDAL